MAGFVTLWWPPELPERRVVVPLREQKVKRLVAALLASLDGWMDQAEEIAEAAHPTTGNKARALHLKIAMATAKESLSKLMADAERD